MIELSKEAIQKWNQIPADIQPKLLSNVYCSKCKDTVKIVDFEATIDNDDLILKGKCENCSANVVRLIEGWGNFKSHEIIRWNFKRLFSL